MWPRVTPSLAAWEINLLPLDLTNEIDGYEYSTCFDGDLVNRDPPD